MFAGPTEQRWSFYVSGPVSQLGISQLWLDQMVLPYVSDLSTVTILSSVYIPSWPTSQQDRWRHWWEFEKHMGFIGKEKKTWQNVKERLNSHNTAHRITFFNQNQRRYLKCVFFNWVTLTRRVFVSELAPMKQKQTVRKVRHVFKKNKEGIEGTETELLTLPM